MRILMAAAENDALPGAKVGGIGDVVRDVPPVLAEKGHDVDVIIPSYGFLHDVPHAREVTTLSYRFAGNNDDAVLYEVPAKQPHARVAHYVVHHPAFVSKDAHGRFEIYHPDPDERPFATDASKYARFCTAVAEAVKNGNLGTIDCLHLHDWHAAFLAILREFSPQFASLKPIRTVYTIHNLALQGVRPFENDVSSLKAWFPDLEYDETKIADPRWKECENPAEAGITLCDVVHTVSPSYATEIIEPSDAPRFYGGEGLHQCLSDANNEGRLTGILNGCEYPEDRVPKRYEFPGLLQLLSDTVLKWASTETGSVSPAHFLAHSRLSELRSRASVPPIVLTVVSRITEQKVFLMKAAGTDAPSGLEGVLQRLRNNHGVCLLLGSGDPEYERFLIQLSGKYPTLVFLNGYSDECAQALYANGDLFLMPSSFEPCGISQMLAMRDGQPCVVHSVGGLKDTVQDGINGFGFGLKGDSVIEQVDKFIATTARAVGTKLENEQKWQEICQNAKASRFLWTESIDKYVSQLYQPQ